MTPDPKRWPVWVRDAVVFLGMVLFNAAMLAIGLYLYRSWDRGEPDWVHWWMWAFAAPVWAIHTLGWNSLTWPLVWINPLIYGLMWWLLWRMFRLMRPKPTDGESPPPNNE